VELQGLARSGGVSAGDLVWCEGMAEWQPAGTVPPFAGLFAAAAPAGGAGAYDFAPQQPGAAPPPTGAPGYYAPQPGYSPPVGVVGYGTYAYQAQFQYAGFWLRFCAVFVDGLIIVIPLVLIFVALGFAFGVFDELSNPQSSGPNGAAILLDLGSRLVFLLVGWLYYAYQESGVHRATFGKRLVGIQVVDMAGERISFGRASGRFFGKIVSQIICYIGYIMAGFTERKQGLHDIMASTLVIRRQ
jgi:uncharacterized RDD family membrane protein YckC